MFFQDRGASQIPATEAGGNSLVLHVEDAQCKQQIENWFPYRSSVNGIVHVQSVVQ